MTEPSIRLVSTLDVPTYHAICLLLPQLTTDSVTPTFEALAAVVAAPGTQLLVAQADGLVVGMATLAVLGLPTGRVAHVEDVVVDETCRGRGIGRLLVEAALAHADQAGARQVDLTSRSTREAANRLYRSLGFEAPDTNLYRYSFVR